MQWKSTNICEIIFFDRPKFVGYFEEFTVIFLFCTMSGLFPNSVLYHAKSDKKGILLGVYLGQSLNQFEFLHRSCFAGLCFNGKITD